MNTKEMVNIKKPFIGATIDIDRLFPYFIYIVISRAFIHLAQQLHM